MAETAELRRHLRDLEERVAGPAARSTRETFEELLDEGFVEFGSSGKVHDRESIISGMSTQSPQAWSIADFKLALLADDVALVTYIATQVGRGSSLRSSVWKRRGGKWRMAFHQGTKIQG